MLKKIIASCLVLISGLILSGNIWFWTDQNGIRHYSNVAPPDAANTGKIESKHEIYSRASQRSVKETAFMVVKVFDGDTVRVRGLDLTFTIRLAGIDSPEIGYNGRPSQPYSRKAKNHLASMVENKAVQIKSYGTGGYNRQLAELYIDSKNINLEMITAGFAEVYTGKLPNGLDSQKYFDMQAMAKKYKRGMWLQGRSYKSPRKWRKEHPRK